jgi:hypothetical protein
MRQHAGVVKQLFTIDGRSGNFLKAQVKKFQRLPLIGRE